MPQLKPTAFKLLVLPVPLFAAASAFYARHVRGPKLRDVRPGVLKPDARPATVFIDVEDVTPADFAAESSKPK